MASLVKPAEVLIEDSCFEDMTSHAWSSAISVGRLVSSTWQAKQRTAEVSPATPSIGSRLSQYKDLHDESTQWAVHAVCTPITISRNTVQRCSLGIVACFVNLHAQKNVLRDVELDGWQLCDAVVDMNGNTVERCGGTALSLRTVMDCVALSRLNGNTYRDCNIGIRLSSTSAAGCKLQAEEEMLDCNGDGTIILIPKCFATFTTCTITGSRRCAARVGHGAQSSFQNCNMSWNGRGVVVASSSSAEIQNCSFDNNIGWAVRLEDAASTSDNSTTIRATVGNVVSGNTFGPVQQGNVGRKRVRIDGWEEGRASAEGNVEREQGAPVMPLLKRRRNTDAEAEEEVANRLGGLSLGGSAVGDGYVGGR